MAPPGPGKRGGVTGPGGVTRLRPERQAQASAGPSRSPRGEHRETVCRHSPARNRCVTLAPSAPGSRGGVGKQPDPRPFGPARTKHFLGLAKDRPLRKNPCVRRTLTFDRPRLTGAVVRPYVRPFRAAPQRAAYDRPCRGSDPYGRCARVGSLRSPTHKVLELSGLQDPDSLLRDVTKPLPTSCPGPAPRPAPRAVYARHPTSTRQCKRGT